MLLGHGTQDSTAIVVFDAFRCSSTLLACFSSGAVGAMIMEKGISERGTSIAQAKTVASRLCRELAFGGEFHGKPVPGGIVGNSPIDACSTLELRDRLLHFQSTNFARAFVDMVNYANQVNHKADIYVISYTNAESTAVAIRNSDYRKILVVCGGFYDCLALEDMILGGLLISHLNVDFPEIDDEGLTMVASHRTLFDKKEIFESCWTGRVLQVIAKSADIADIVGTSRIPSVNLELMKNLVLKVSYFDGIPIIMPTQPSPRPNLNLNMSHNSV